MALIPFDTFVFSHRALEHRTVRLGYELEGGGQRLQIEEKLFVPFDPQLDIIDPADLDAALTGLHLIGGISYWKTCCPPQILIEDNALSSWDASFWNEVYTQGLGEFFFRNQLDSNNKVRFPPGCPATDKLPISREAEGIPLVLVGGGKDSIVSHEILRLAARPHCLLFFGDSSHIEMLIKQIDAQRLMVERHLDPQLFDLNAAGAFNGHIPISAYYAFAAQFIAVIGGFGAIIASNERSASQGNLSVGEFEVNHQWSKGIRFEELFQEWQRRHLNRRPTYFSLLRPLSELRIAREFAKYPEHFTQFSSCNLNFRQRGDRPSQRWCGHCSKCLFVFTMLAPWLGEQTLAHIFGNNLFANDGSRSIIAELLGVEGHKPFDCVGSPEEVAAALWLCHSQGRYRDTPAGQVFIDHILPKLQSPHQLLENLLTPTDEHRIPPTWLNLIHAYLADG